MKISKFITIIQSVIVSIGSVMVIHQHCITGSFTILFGGFAVVICSIIVLAKLNKLFSKEIYYVT
jgi:hypothetical protein